MATLEFQPGGNEMPQSYILPLTGNRDIRIKEGAHAVPNQIAAELTQSRNPVIKDLIGSSKLRLYEGEEPNQFSSATVGQAKVAPLFPEDEQLTQRTGQQNSSDTLQVVGNQIHQTIPTPTQSLATHTIGENTTTIQLSDEQLAILLNHGLLSVNGQSVNQQIVIDPKNTKTSDNKLNDEPAKQTRSTKK